MLQKNEIEAGMLVTRDCALFLVVEIGECYHDGFALCRYVGKHHSGEYWIMKSLLCPLPSNEEVA